MIRALLVLVVSLCGALIDQGRKRRKITMTNIMLPDHIKRDAPLATVSGQCLISDATPALPIGGIRKTGRAAMPIAPMYFNIGITDLEVRSIVFKEWLFLKRYSTLSKPGGYSDLCGACPALLAGNPRDCAAFTPLRAILALARWKNQKLCAALNTSARLFSSAYRAFSFLLAGYRACLLAAVRRSGNSERRSAYSAGAII